MYKNQESSSIFPKLVMMWYSILTVLFLLLILHSPLATSSSRLTGQVKSSTKSKTFVTMKKHETLQIAGSGLPDCSNACGACRPCRLVMVSFICATLEEAESCPMAYKCMCRERAFPVP